MEVSGVVCASGIWISERLPVRHRTLSADRQSETGTERDRQNE